MHNSWKNFPRARNKRPARAQEPILLGDVIVENAARDERAVLDAPVGATVPPREELVLRDADTYEELIGDVPGVLIEGGPRGAAQEPNIRGFSDEQITLRIDGGRFNFNQSHRGRFFIDPDIVERVEVTPTRSRSPRIACSTAAATGRATTRSASPRNVPERSCRCLSQMFPDASILTVLTLSWFLTASDARSLHIAQGVRGNQRGYVGAGPEHQCSGHLSPPDFQAALHRAEQSVRINVRMGGLEIAQKLTPGL